MNSSEQPTHPIRLQGLAPLLQVFDMPVSLHFYRDILGFSVVQSSGEGDDVDWVLLRGNDCELMLNTAYEKAHRPAATDGQRRAAHGDTTLYFGCPDTEGAYTYLAGKGLAVTKPELTGYGWKALHLTDPDGYHLCFHYPLPDTATVPR